MRYDVNVQYMTLHSVTITVHSSKNHFVLCCMLHLPIILQYCQTLKFKPGNVNPCKMCLWLPVVGQKVLITDNQLVLL